MENQTLEAEQTEQTTPYRFRIKVADEIFGLVRSPKTKEETLEILHKDLLISFGEHYEILEFTEVSEEEWQEAAEGTPLLDNTPQTPVTLN